MHGYISSLVITEVKHVELNQFSDGLNFLGSGKSCCRKVWTEGFGLAANVKMEIPAPVRLLKSSILSSTSFQMDNTFWGVGSAAVEQSRRKDNMVAQGDGNFGPEADPRVPPNQKNGHIIMGFLNICYCSQYLSLNCRNIWPGNFCPTAACYLSPSHLCQALVCPGIFQLIFFFSPPS